MFGPIDITRPYSILTVNSPVKIMPLRRAALSPGVYHIQGDIRPKLGHRSVRELQVAGLISVEFMPTGKVSARTQFASTGKPTG